MKKLSKIFIALVALLCLSFSFSACFSSCYKERYYDYHVIWYSEDPYIVFAGDRHYGFMELDGKNYMLEIAWQPHGSEIYFYDKDKIGGSGVTRDDYLIWEADTKIADGQLILTVTVDKVSDYEGKTVILNQKPFEDGSYRD